MDAKEKKREYNRKYQQEHKKEISRKHKEWLAANPDKVKDAFKKRYHADIEASRAKSRAAYQRSLEKNARRVRRLKRIMSKRCREENPAYYKQYRLEHKEHYREYIKNYMRKWRKKHPRKTKQHMNNCYKKNPIPFFEGAARRRARKQNAEGSHRYAEWLTLLEKCGYRCHYCQKLLTVRTATRDHLIPLSRGGSDDIGNITPACRYCNGSKGTKTHDEYITVISTGPSILT